MPPDDSAQLRSFGFPHINYTENPPSSQNEKRNRKECIRPNHHIWIRAYKEKFSHIALLIVKNKMLLGNWQMIRIPGTNIAGSYNISKYEIFCFNHFSLNPTQFFAGFESDFHLCGR
jgi:hypothetical protein